MMEKAVSWWEVPDVLSLSPSGWAVHAYRWLAHRSAGWAFYCSPIGAGSMDRIRKRSPIIRSGWDAGGEARPACRRSRWRTVGFAQHRIANRRANRGRDRDIPAMGIMLKSSAGTSMILVNDISITIQTTGLLTLTGTTVAITDCAGDHLGGICQASYFIRAR